MSITWVMVLRVCLVEELLPLVSSNVTYSGSVGVPLMVQCATGSIRLVEWYTVRGDSHIPMLSKDQNVITIKYDAPLIKHLLCIASNDYEDVTSTLNIVIT